jgi:hypothetical protein
MRDQLIKVYKVLNELFKDGLVPSGEFQFVSPKTPGLIDLEVQINENGELGIIKIVTKRKVIPMVELQLTLEQAKTMGYTGNTCAKCSSPRMVRRGTCEYCEDCQESSGCS